MKKAATIIVALFFGCASLLAAQQNGSGDARPMMAPGPDGADFAYLAQALNGALTADPNATLGAITFGDVKKALDRISVAAQETAYVHRAQLASRMLPGAGELLVGDTGPGILFLSGSILVDAGSLLGWYFLLPADLQFSSLNYFTDSFQTIRTAWESHSLVDYLPSAGVMAAGMVVDHILGAVSSRHAGRAAREAIQQNRVHFEPRPYFMMGGPGRGMGFGMNMRY